MLAAYSDRGDGARKEDVVAKHDDGHIATIVRMHQLVGLARHFSHEGKGFLIVLKHIQ